MNIFYKILICLSVLLISCEQDNNLINSLSVSNDNITFSEEGGSSQIEIETNANIWAIYNPADDWINLSTNSGTKHDSFVVLSVNSKTLVPRIDTLILRAGNASPIKMIVSQDASEFLYDLSVNKKEISIPKNGGSDSIFVTTNSPVWSFSSTADWIKYYQKKVSTNTERILLNVNSRTLVPRKDTLTIRANNAKPVKVIISQDASEFLYDISVEKNNLNFEKAGGSLSLQVNTKAPAWSFSTKSEWIVLNQSSSYSGSDEININVSYNPDSNSRTGKITIKAINAPSIEITVVQAG